MLDAFGKIRVGNPQLSEDCSINLAGCDQGGSFFGFNVTVEKDVRGFEEGTVCSKDIVLGRAEVACTKKVRGSGCAMQKTYRRSRHQNLRYIVANKHKQGQAFPLLSEGTRTSLLFRSKAF